MIGTGGRSDPARRCRHEDKLRAMPDSKAAACAADPSSLLTRCLLGWMAGWLAGSMLGWPDWLATTAG